MFKSKKGKLIVVVLAFVVLAMFSLACGESKKVVPPIATHIAHAEWCKVEGGAAPESARTAAEERHQIMHDAAHYNQIVFQDDRGGYAICEGTKRLATLKEPGKVYRFEFTTQEILNLRLCKWNEEAGTYRTVADISGAAPGQYLHWDTNGSLKWTK